MVRPFPNPVKAVEGKDFYVNCPVSGYPIEDVTWSKGDETFCFARWWPWWKKIVCRFFLHISSPLNIVLFWPLRSSCLPENPMCQEMVERCFCILNEAQFGMHELLPLLLEKRNVQRVISSYFTFFTRVTRAVWSFLKECCFPSLPLAVKSNGFHMCTSLLVLLLCSLCT